MDSRLCGDTEQTIAGGCPLRSSGTQRPRGADDHGMQAFQHLESAFSGGHFPIWMSDVPACKRGKVAMRPWADTEQCNERNGVLHWDYIHLGQSYSGYKYLLVLKDEATHNCELVPCAVSSSTVTAEAIMEWHSRFGAPPVWESDQGCHFKNAVVNG